MPHRPNPIPRLNNPQYASNSVHSGQSASPNAHNGTQSGTHGGTSGTRRDLNHVPPRHRGQSFSASHPPSATNPDGSHSNRGERTGGGSHRTLPPPRFQRKQRPPRVQNILAGTDNADGPLGTLTFGPASNWGVGTQSVISLPMAAVNAASSAAALSAGPPPNVAPSPSGNLALNASIEDRPAGLTLTTTSFPQIGVDSAPPPTNDSPPHLSFGMSGSAPRSTTVPTPSTYLPRIPSDEDIIPTTQLHAQSVVASYSASAPVTANDGYAADHSLDFEKSYLAAPSVSVNTTRPRSRDVTPPKVDSVPYTPLKSALKHQRSIPNLNSTVYSSSPAYSALEKPLPSIPVLHSAHKVKFFDEPEVIPRSPYIRGLEHERHMLGMEEDVLGSEEDGFHALDERSAPFHRAGLDDWDDFTEAIKMYATGLVEDEDHLSMSSSLAPRPAARISPPSWGSNPPPTAVPAGFAESTALTRTTRGRPISTLSTHAHRIPHHVSQPRSRSRSPSPTLSGNGSSESAGSMGSLPGLGSFGSGSMTGSKLSLQSTLSSRPLSVFSNNASMASLTSRSTISSGKSLRTIDSYGSLRSTASGAFGAGPLLGAPSIWAMDKQEAGASVGNVGVAGGTTLTLVPEEGSGFSGTGYGLPKGAAPALEPFGAFEPTPRRKDRSVNGFSNATIAHLPKKTQTSAFHANVPSDVSDNPFSSIEAIRGSPPSSPRRKPSSLVSATHHAPLLPTAEPFIPRKGMTSAVPSKFSSAAVSSSLSGNAKAFVPRSSTINDIQFSGIPFETTVRAPGRVGVRRMEDAFIGGAGIIGEGA